MARSRNLKPGYFTNDELAEIGPLGQLLFAGLWTLADREGRLLDRPRKIKAEILPYYEADCDALLDALAVRHFILRYQVAGSAYIQIVNWHKHQSPHVKEAASELPAPERYATEREPAPAYAVQAPDEHQTSTVQTPDEHGTSPPDSLNLIPDTGYPQPEIEITPPTVSAGADDVAPASRSRASPHTPGGVTEHDEAFHQRFWPAWPRKVSKSEALHAWRKIRPDPATVERILAAIPRQSAAWDWPREGYRYCPHPATWLRQRRWEDELPPEALSAAGAPRRLHRWEDFLDEDGAMRPKLVNGKLIWPPGYRPSQAEINSGLRYHKQLVL